MGHHERAMAILTARVFNVVSISSVFVVSEQLAHHVRLNMAAHRANDAGRRRSSASARLLIRARAETRERVESERAHAQ